MRITLRMVFFAATTGRRLAERPMPMADAYI
jgi:hypothetical protein